MLSKGKGTAALSADTRCPSSEATAPGDAGVGDEAGPSPRLSTFLRYICSGGHTVLVTREAVPVPGLGSVSPGIWEMQLTNVQSNISTANLKVLLQVKSPFLPGTWKKKKKKKSRSQVQAAHVVGKTLRLCGNLPMSESTS